ncbi:MAG: LLM class flavin-dependent oxidoreductase [Sciscionella sp.]
MQRLAFGAPAARSRGELDRAVREQRGSSRTPVPLRAAHGGSPMLLAAFLPRMVQLAGVIADGVALSATTPASLSAALAEIAHGLAPAGRRRAGITVACVLPCCFDGDNVARRAGCGVVTGYARHLAAVAWFEASVHGEPDVANQPVDDFVLTGIPDRCGERVASYLDAGIDMPILFPTPWDGSARRTIDIATGLLPAASASTHRKVPT